MNLVRACSFCAALAALMLLQVALGPSLASAQYHLSRPTEPTREALTEARELFVAGSQDVEAGRWADALRKFERSYALSGVAAALYNAATALRSLGRHREARDAFDQLLREHDDLDATLRNEATLRREEEAARVAVLALAGLPARVNVRVSLDGTEVTDTGRRPLELDSDAGRHTVRVEHERYEPWSWTGDVLDGRYQTLDVSLRPRGGTSDGPHEGGRSIFASPWFWVVTGVVVVAATATIVYAVHEGAQLDPASHNVVDVR